YQKAEPLYQRSLAIREKVLGKEHPDVAQRSKGIAKWGLELPNYWERNDNIVITTTAIYVAKLYLRPESTANF
ncbi:MAG: tetratricopeptide repeat protein, partial [Stigonema ocellatum SAG 48.90 = DSM 106950]|nr:tetratricopeptide repeat protein [Stigonema ocellatum SAG 48.90 = DSM 106950]